MVILIGPRGGVGLVGGLAALVQELRGRVKAVPLRVRLLAGLVFCGDRVSVRVRVRPRCGVIGVKLPLYRHLIDFHLGRKNAVHQQRLVRSDRAVGVGVAQADGQLFHRQPGGDLFLAVGHVDVNQLGELVDLEVPLVPELQGRVTVDFALANLLVQGADGGQAAVDFVNVLVQLGDCAFLDLFQLVGVFIQQGDQVLGRHTDGVVVLLVPGLLFQVFKRLHQLADLQAQDAEAALALAGVAFAHLVQNPLDLVQDLQLAVREAHLGVQRPVADVQVGAADLGEALDQRALAGADIALGVIAVRPVDVEAYLIQALAGVARGVDVGNIVSCHGNAGLGGINRQPGLREGAKGTNAHIDILLILSLLVRLGNPFSWTEAGRCFPAPCRSRVPPARRREGRPSAQ